MDIYYNLPHSRHLCLRSLPGIGQLMVQSIFARDLPVVQGVTLVFGVLVVLINLLTDVGYALLDPRVRFSR